MTFQEFKNVEILKTDAFEKELKDCIKDQLRKYSTFLWVEKRLNIDIEQCLNEFEIE